MNTKNTNFKFRYFNYKIEQNIITNYHIKDSIDAFYKKELVSLDTNQKIFIIFKIMNTEGDWRCISTNQTTTNSDSDKNDLYNVFTSFWSLRSDDYHNMLISSITFKYKLFEDHIAPDKSRFNFPNIFDKTSKLNPKGYDNLPNNTEISKWSDNVYINDNKFNVAKDNYSLKATSNNNNNYVDVTVGKNTILSFVDQTSKDPNTFVRSIGNNKYYYKDGKNVFSKQLVKTKYIKPSNEDLALKDNYITMDFETRDVNKVKHVIAISIYDGKTVNSFFISDYLNSEVMLIAAVESILLRKYNGYKIYFHNFSNFDAVFLLRILANLNDAVLDKVIKRDGRIINLKLKYNISSNRSYSIYFRDSLLILPLALKKLGENFDVEIKKTIYPYTFVNDSNVNLNYVGNVPTINHFNNISNKEYRDYNKKFNNNWSIRNETIKYCENDVISLWQIISKFQNKIFNKFSIDVNNSPTLSSLAFRIYRVRYLKDYKIPCISGSLYKDIKNSYTGGSVDVYKPVGKNIYRYDVNSLYPFVMSKYPSPVGNVYKFNGDILKYKSELSCMDNENSFGFFKVKVTTPPNLKVPILQTKVKTPNGTRTVAPIGQWEGWYFSEEIINAIKHGYVVEVKSGYLFDKEYIFSEYVNDLYNLKKQSVRDSADYVISKLLLNGLYGRFGMNPYKENNVIIKGTEAISRFLNNNIVTDVVTLGDNIELISFVEDNEMEDKITSENISVPISSSITAYGRITMSEFKLKYANNLHYSDTDSIDLDTKLPDKYLSGELGDFKMENFYKKSVYIAPKVYAGVLSDNKKFIKIKGLKQDIAKTVNYSDIEKLLVRGNEFIINQEKWFKDLSTAEITTKEQKYSLMITENKRKGIYNNNKYSDTVPYKLINGVLR